MLAPLMYDARKVDIRYNFEAGKVYWATIRNVNYVDSVVFEDRPARRGEYQSNYFDPDVFIKKIQKTRQNP